ncbi:hypothetical protein [Natronorubrum texcoconense]|uniref:Uncharacterized protein n=1 Tax=Natronorubrum texcoconense TaxID=1095776 RepID=A0A1G9DTH9_9EURY|nr:hypothetical protein [Natronorubrum texcoconense]SDK67135.1 hypothetical protein SAMN04515672_3614 [Natronorubrum texcoconense]
MLRPSNGRFRREIGVTIASLFGLLLLASFSLEETELVGSQNLTVGEIGEWRD